MAELHKALESLGPVDFSDVPVDSLDPYIRHIFEAGELICNSVPPPSGGTDFSAAQPANSTPDAASSAKEILFSEARAPPPHQEHADLQKSWGKPIKLSAKENELGISVYKMAGKDRHGAWFARRSVHEGLSFTKFKRGMQREFAESLTVQGGPGEGNVRGIGGDRRLERKKVESVKGQMEVFQLSAQFPGPTTPREFITLLLTGENALSDKSSDQSTGDAHIPRHFMVVSKPVTHPEAPERTGYVRGHYESVEMIREIPIHKAPSNNGDEKATGAGKHELNPVEWIMITRSDPGGGIPRFMVERGTPSSICGDAVKFLDWVCPKDEVPDADADEDQQKAAQAQHAQPATQQAGGAPTTSQPSNTRSQPQQAEGGIVSHLTYALEAGIDAYAPASVAAYTHQYLHQEDDTSEDSSDSDSTTSFASAQDFPITQNKAVGATGATSTHSLVSSTTSGHDSTLAGSSHHDKEILKLDEKRQKLDAKLAKKREAEDEKFAAQKQKDSTDESKAAEKHSKELRKIEERRQKELAKIEAKKEKELRKAEKKRQKDMNSEATSRLTHERDDFRFQLDSLKRENVLLKEQATDLTRENQILVEKLAHLGGSDALKSVKHDVEAGS